MTNIPYRGEVDHGVPHEPIAALDESTYWKDADKTDYEDEHKAVDPIPVRVVNQGAREMRSYDILSYVLTNTTNDPVQVLGRDNTRTKVTVSNQGVGAVFICDSSVSWRNIQAASGEPYGAFRLSSGEKVSLAITEELWLLNNQDGPSFVALLIERSEAVE